MSKVVKAIAGVAIAVVGVVTLNPVLIGFGVGTAVGAVVPGKIGLALATLLGGVPGLVGALGARDPKTPSLEQTGAVSRGNAFADPNALAAFCFGQTAVPLALVFEENHGTENELLSDVFAHCYHQIDSYLALHVEGEEVSFSGEAATGDWAGILTWKRKLGTRPQTAITLTGTAWPSTATGDGVAHSALIWNFKNQDKLQGGVPNQLIVEAKGALMYDPRKDTTVGGSGAHRYDDPSTFEWSDNAALILLRYIIGEFENGKLLWGRGEPQDDVDLDSFMAAANVADEIRDGIPRFRLGGMSLTDNNHERFFSEFENNTGGKVSRIGGKWFIWLPHDDLTSTLTITEADLLDKDMQQVAHGGALWNSARGRYIEPSELFQGKPYPDVEESAAITDDGKRRTLQIDFSWVQDVSIAERIARMQVRRSRFDRVWTIAMGWKGALLKPFDVVTLNIAASNFENQLVRVIDVRSSTTGVHVVTLQEEDASIYDDTVTLGTPKTTDTIPGRLGRIGTVTPRFVSGTSVEDRAGPAIGEDSRLTEAKRIRGVQAGGLDSGFNVTPITGWTDTGSAARLDIQASTLRVGGNDISYPSGSVSGLSYDTEYHVYRDDQNLDGGGTYLATTSGFTAISGEDRVYFGSFLTGSSGGGGGGPSPPPGQCVAMDQWLLPGVRAQDAKPGMEIEVLNGDGVETAQIDEIAFAEGICVLVETESASLVCSISTPLTLSDGRMVNVLQGLGEEVPVLNGGFRWEKVISIKSAGFRNIARIHIGGRTYAAGTKPEARILTHNPLK